MGEFVISQDVIANLRSGLPIVYPTSTLPGLGGIPNKETLARVYELKNRKGIMPVSLGVANLNQVNDLVIIPEIARILDYFPKGSLTLILKAKQPLDYRLGGDMIAIRVFSNPIAIQLSDECGPIIATSANISGQEPVEDCREAARLLGLETHRWIEGICPGGKGSTILKFESEEYSGKKVTIIREGVVLSSDVMEWMTSQA
tara:strand:+ start:100 stop:705 length:606 start_codon:yes stop_codon:yes gene_type:complete